MGGKDYKLRRKEGKKEFILNIGNQEGNSNISGIDLADFALLQGSVVERCD